MNNAKKQILIIQTAFLGDTALALFFAQSVYNHFEGNAEITFVSNANASSLINVSACISHNISFDKRKEHKGKEGLQKIASQINQKHYDYLFCLHRSIRSAYLSKLINAKEKIGFKNSAMNYVFDYKADYLHFKHEIIRNLQLLKVIGISNEEKPKIETRYSPESIEKINQLITESNGKKIVLIAPGSVWETKKWSKNNYKALVSKLIQFDYYPILIGAKNEIELCNYISDEALKLTGKTTIEETIYLMSISDLLITNDSSPIHFAQIAGLKTIAIFGPTSPMFGFAPASEGDIVLYNDKLKCSPCRIHGSKKCPIKTHICMESISPEEVFLQVEKSFIC